MSDAKKKKKMKKKSTTSKRTERVNSRDGDDRGKGANAGRRTTTSSKPKRGEG